MPYIFVYVRAPAEVDVACEVLDGEDVCKHGAIEADVSAGHGDEDARAARSVADAFILKSTQFLV